MEEKCCPSFQNPLDFSLSYSIFAWCQSSPGPGESLAGENRLGHCIWLRSFGSPIKGTIVSRRSLETYIWFSGNHNVKDSREAGSPEVLLWPRHPQAQQTSINGFSQNQTRCAQSQEAAGSNWKKGQSPAINCWYLSVIWQVHWGKNWPLLPFCIQLPF